MSHDSYICGFIKLNSDIERTLSLINLLPETQENDDWPYLTRSMFSYTQSPEYRDKIVHFAASYKDICGSWKEWEAKFEQLLERLDFDEVKILVEDCYQGDFIVGWFREYEGQGVVHRKICKKLSYEKEPDVELV